VSVIYKIERTNNMLVVMDNYFTMTKTMIGTRKCNVAAMGTARDRPG
jgi:hypothetical protein